MGSKQSVFTEQEMDDYLDLTFFTKREIELCYQKFKSLAPEIVLKNRDVRLPMNTIQTMPELKMNPFNDRICKVFSTSNDGHMTFEDFLDMMSVFSEDAPVSVKAEYAFKIFDFDEDDMMGPEDLEQLINRLLGDEELQQRDIKQLVKNLTAEADLDDDGLLSFAEFEHVVAKSTDFVQAFRMRI
ncbi:unnamed protein product [Orchesella dallaii]|uniref:EF-hand domain-containing protein n=2 Tax=Orchesella dallaii TaxID=48710 RepID=A0ABP1PJZ3_9HEXA